MTKKLYFLIKLFKESCKEKSKGRKHQGTILFDDETHPLPEV